MRRRPEVMSRLDGGFAKLRLFSVLIVLGGAATLWTASARADYTWTGNFFCGGQFGCSYQDGWSEGNWTTGPPSAGNPTLGTLSFPALPACGQGTCYASLDDLSFPMSATGIDIDDAVGYDVQGDDGEGTPPPIGLGSGGITATAAPATNALSGGADWLQPLALTAPQTWSITGENNAPATAFYFGPVTSAGANPSAESLGITLGDQQTLTFGAGLDVGAFTVSGANPSDLGNDAAFNGTLYSPNINGNDAAPVTINNVVYAVEPNVVHLAHTQTVGPLTTNGAWLQVGDGNLPDAILSVNGTVNLGPTSVTGIEIDQAGSMPGTDFAQLQATGGVSLAGQLTVDGGPCTVGVGETATLITTTGTLSGTFANVANGAMTPMVACYAPNSSVLGAQVTYGTHTMTATVVPGSSTATLLAENPASPTANQPVTLTANVSAATLLQAGPAGTVEFLEGTTPIAGCTAQSLTANSANTGTATCATSFATAEPTNLSAVFTPTGSALTGSSSTGVSTGTGQGPGAGSGSTPPTGSGSAPPTGSGSTPPAGQGSAQGPTGTSATTQQTSGGQKSSTPKLGAAKVTGTAVGVPVTCSGGTSCTLSLALSITEELKGGQITAFEARGPKAAKTKTIRKTVTVGHTAATVAANGKRTVQLTLNAAGKRLLTQRHTLAVKLTVAVKNRVLTSRVLHFKVPRKR
jgi:hypothetical protein